MYSFFPPTRLLFTKWSERKWVHIFINFQGKVNIHQELDMSWLKWSRGPDILTSSNEFPVSLLQKVTWNHRGQICNLCWNPMEKQHTELQAAWRCISIKMIEQQTNQSSKSQNSAFVSMPPMCSMKVLEEMNSELSVVLKCYPGKSARIAGLQGRARHC